MPTITTHILDSVHGKHAPGLRVTLYRIDADRRELLFTDCTDDGGRLRREAALEADCVFELTFALREYFGGGILHEAAVRFVTREGQTAYHFPMMVAPSSCSVWGGAFNP